MPNAEYEIVDIENITHDMLAKVEQGFTLIINGLKEGDYKVSGSKIEVKDCAMLPVHFVSRNMGHKWVREFSPYDFKMWYNKDEDMITPIVLQLFHSVYKQPLYNA